MICKRLSFAPPPRGILLLVFVAAVVGTSPPAAAAMPASVPVTVPVMMPVTVPVMVAVTVLMVVAVAALLAVAGGFTVGQLPGEVTFHEQFWRLHICPGEYLDPRLGELVVRALADPAGDHHVDLLADEFGDRAAALLLRRGFQHAGIQDAARGGIGLEHREARRPAEVRKQSIVLRGDCAPKHDEIIHLGLDGQTNPACLRHAEIGCALGSF